MSTNKSKAASMFVLMGEEAAADVMSHLSEAEIEQLAKQISTTGPMAGEEAEEEAEELYGALLGSRGMSEGGVDYAQKLIKKTLGSGLARRINERISSGATDSEAFRSLNQVDAVQLSQFLQQEHPQTIALVLSHLSPPTAAEILTSLAENRRSDVAVRMATLDEVPPEVISSVAAVLEARLQPVGKTGPRPDLMGGIRSVAEMFNRMERKTSRAVLEEIESEKPDLSNSIRQVMFIFEDVSLLDDIGMREVLQRVDKKTIAQALKGTEADLQNHFFRNMSGRAVEIMKEEMDLMGPVKTEEVAVAQQSVIEIVQQLEEEGVISIGRGGSEYVV